MFSSPPGWKRYLNKTMKKVIPGLNRNASKNVPVKPVQATGAAPIQHMYSENQLQKPIKQNRRNCVSPSGLAIPCPNKEQQNINRQLKNAANQYISLNAYNDHMYETLKTPENPDPVYNSGRVSWKNTTQRRNKTYIGSNGQFLPNSMTKNVRNRMNAQAKVQMVPLSPAMDMFLQQVLQKNPQYATDVYVGNPAFNKVRLEKILQYFYKNSNAGVRVDKKTGQKFISKYDLQLVQDLQDVVEAFMEQVNKAVL